jgi:serine/threonine-protein kinase
VPTENLAALDAYFMGKEQLVQRAGGALIRAIEFFEEAVREDPDFALAYSGLADAFMVLPEYSASVPYDPERINAEVQSAARRALSRDPTLPEAYVSMGWSLLHQDYDWVGAERLLRHALEIQPQNLNALHSIDGPGRFGGVME